jgi:hypothetical protein
VHLASTCVYIFSVTWIREELKGRITTEAHYHRGALPQRHITTEAHYHRGALPEAHYHSGTLPQRHITTEAHYHSGTLPQWHITREAHYQRGTLPQRHITTKVHENVRQICPMLKSNLEFLCRFSMSVHFITVHPNQFPNKRAILQTQTDKHYEATKCSSQLCELALKRMATTRVQLLARPHVRNSSGSHIQRVQRDFTGICNSPILKFKGHEYMEHYHHFPHTPS